MTMAEYTVVLLPDPSTSSPEVGTAPDFIEDVTFVAHVQAGNVSEAYAAGQVAAAESGLGPREPIDWCVIFMCEGHVRNCSDDPDVAT
jgi:hypothetical protein